MSGTTTRAAELLRVVHTAPGVTRADAARRIGVGSGAATELVARLLSAGVLSEQPAAPSGGRGRPTTVLLPHPAGPLVLAGSVTHEAWRLDVVELGGAALATTTTAHDGRDGAVVLAAVGAAATEFARRFPGRVRGLGLAVPGTVTAGRWLDASPLGWHDVDLTQVWADAEVFAAGNDATLAGAAESWRGSAAGATLALHVRVAAGLGGALVGSDHALAGATGLSGEFGHMPFGDPAVVCPCGARGCWGTAVDGSALARLLGRAAPADPVSYARRVIGRAATHPAEARAVHAVATALGRGVAGLVNGLDPDLVTLGGLGVDLLAADPDAIGAGYRAGLMRVRRADPPPVLAAALGENGPLAGAAEQAWSLLLPRLP